MPDPWRLRVEGVPSPKGSPTIMRRGKGGRPFMLESGKQRAHEQAIRESARRYAKLHPVPMTAWAQRQEGAVVLSVWFVLPAPKWVTGRRRANSKRTGFEPRATRKPDVDKLLRTVLDGLTGYAYRDDAQVVGFGVVKKSYADPGEVPHTFIVAEFLDPEEPC